MASLADLPVNITSEGMNDFVLFPGQENQFYDWMSRQLAQSSADQPPTPSSSLPPQEQRRRQIQQHFQTQQSYGQTPSSSSLRMDPAFSQPATTTDMASFYAPYGQVPAEQQKQQSHQVRNQAQAMTHSTSQGSPAISLAQSVDNPPSTTLSSTSGTSVPSANSSAFGSPYPNQRQYLYSADKWSQNIQGLGLNPSIVQSESGGSDMFTSSGTESESLFATEKIPAEGFVGEYQDNFSSSAPPSSRNLNVPSNTSVSSSSSSSSSLATAWTFDFAASVSEGASFPPSLALDTSGLANQNITVDTILEEVNREIVSRQSSSPVSARQSRRTSLANATKSPSRAVFKSPITPASANTTATHSPRPRSPNAVRQQRTTSLSAEAPASKRVKTSPTSPTTQAPSRSLQNATGLQDQDSQGPAPVEGVGSTSPFSNLYRSSFFSQSSDPSLLQQQPFQNLSPNAAMSGSPPARNPMAFQSPQAPYFAPPSPAPSAGSAHSLIPGSARMRGAASSPGMHHHSFQPYPPAGSRRPSISSDRSRLSTHGSPRSASFDTEEDGKERTTCPNPDCRRVIKDLKAHMLTHQSERPEKCPIVTCEYHTKGFARKYDKQRHTLTHYKGTMVCGFCPHSGSSAEKSFNRADVFKRHLMMVHSVEQNPPNSRKKGPAGALSSASPSKKATIQAQDATGKCSTCSGTFNGPQEFYEHLDDCVLRMVQKEEPSEAINEKHITSVEGDQSVEETLRAHALPTASSRDAVDDDDDEDQAEDEEDDGGNGYFRQSGDGTDPSRDNGGRSDESSVEDIDKDASRRGTKRKHGKLVGMTRSKGGVPLVGKGKKRRRNYPLSWGSNPEKMKMKKRVCCMFDGPKRLFKDDMMMLDSDFEVRLHLADGKSYVTDLDVQTLRRADAIHNATDEERGPYDPNNDLDGNGNYERYEDSGPTTASSSAAVSSVWNSWTGTPAQVEDGVEGDVDIQALISSI